MRGRSIALGALFAGVVIISSVSGCASTGFLMAKPEVVLYGPPLPAKPTNAPIEVFESQKPTRPYQEIAKIEVGDTDDNWSMAQILKKAREIGADGVLITGRSGHYGVGVPAGSAVYAATEAYGLVAIAFKYK